MANPHKALTKEIALLESYKGMDPSQVRTAYKALLDVIDDELAERRKRRFFPRIPARMGLASMPMDTLQEHGGWALRMISTASSLLENQRSTSQDRDVLQAMLQRGKDQLIIDRQKFAPTPKASLFARMKHALKVKAAAFRAELKKHRPEISPINREVYNFKDFLEQRDSDLSSSTIQTGTTAQLLDVDKAAMSGVPLTVPLADDIWECKRRYACDEGWVYGARWGSEDYPCPECQPEKYEEWLKLEHPEEVEEEKKDANLPLSVS
jgi:hypothetical protein